MRLSRVTIAAALVVNAACGSDTTAPSGRPLDIARVFQALDGPPSWTATVIPNLGTPPGSVSCPYQAASQSFVCAPVTASGLTSTLAYTLYDAAGTPQAVADAGRIASVKTVADITGTTTSPADAGVPPTTQTVNGHEERTMTGLLTGKPVVNGTGTMATEKTSTIDGQEVRTKEETRTTTSGLALPPLGTPAATAYPLAGTITHDGTLSVTRGATTLPTLALRTVASFNGTSVVTLTQTVAGTTRTCRYDMAKPDVPPVCS